MNKGKRVKFPKSVEGKSVLDDPGLKAEGFQKVDEDNKKLQELSFPDGLPEKRMSGQYIAAQLRQAAQQLGPVISNLDQQKSELLLKEVEKIAEHLRKLANLICEAVALGQQPNLFESIEEEDKLRLAKTLFSKDAPDKKSLAAGDKPEPLISLDERADAAAQN